MRLTLIGAASVLTVGVAGCGDAPHHTVIDNMNMVIYHAEKRADAKLGAWEYWVRDNSTNGWKFITDKEFKVGDKLVVDAAR